MRNLNTLINNLKLLLSTLDKKNGKGFIQSYLRMSHEEYNHFQALENAPLATIMEAFYKMGINVDCLQDGILDIQCVEDKINNTIYVPQRYNQGARSKWIVTQNVLKEIKRNYGPHEYEQVLLYFQISPHYLDNYYSDKFISTELNSDLYKYIKKYLHGTSKDLYRLGANMYMHFKDTAFSKSFKGLSPKATYAKFLVEVVNHIEVSYQYSLAKLTDDKAVIHKRLRNEAKQELRTNVYGSKEVCEYSIGFASSILYHATNHTAHTEETRCLYHGSDYCEYVVHFDQPIAC